MKWIALFGALAVLLAFDLWLARRESRGAGMSVRTATLHSIGWLVVALAFGGVMLALLGGRDAGLYFAGFLVEKSLSLDNVFVFLLILTSFGIPDAQRHRLLTWGIVAALVLRGLFIARRRDRAAPRQLDLLHLRGAADLDGLADVPPPSRQRGGDGLRREAQGAAARTFGGDRRPSRRWSIADIVFAIDSVPSILAITDDPFIVFAANAFALLGLAPLFFLVADLVERLYYLKTALAALLVLIGIKMAAGELVGQARAGGQPPGDRARARHRGGGLAGPRPPAGARVGTGIRPDRRRLSGGGRRSEDDGARRRGRARGRRGASAPRGRARSARCRGRSRVISLTLWRWPTRSDVLLDDRPGVELLGDVVRGRADDLHAAVARALVGVGAGEGRQERVVDVDDRDADPVEEVADSICM